MTQHKWQVRVPEPSFMAGINHFKDQDAALSFIDRLNDYRRFYREPVLKFYSFGPRVYEAA